RPCEDPQSRLLNRQATSPAWGEPVLVSRQSFPKSDRGRKRLSPSPPSEPCVRFSRTRLSSRWFPHRDWLASFQAVCMVNSPWAAKNLPPLTPFSSAANMRSFHTDASTHLQSLLWASAPCVATSGTPGA